MKLKWFWNESYATDEVGVELHPSNKHLAANIQSAIIQERQLEVIDPKNERKSTINAKEILLIEAMDHLSKVYTTDDRVFYAKGRLKDFEHLQSAGIYRINNSVILNLAQLDSFKSGQYARLEVYTKDGQTFTVSRHYAKQIKTALSK